MQINLRKAMFVLPNLFTCSSIFLGFYAMTLCAGDPSPAELNQAALAIFFAIFFDAFDGRVAAGTIVSIVIAHYRAFGSITDASARIPIAAVIALLSFLMVSTIRYRTFKDVHLSPKSLAVFGLMCLGGLAVGVATRASFVMVVYMGAYIAMGLAEWVISRGRPEPSVAGLPPGVRAQIEADPALEPDDDDVESKDEGDEYI